LGHPVIDLHIHVGNKNMIKPFVWKWVEEFMEAGNGLDRVANSEGELDPAALEAFLEECGIDYGVCLAELSPITTGMTSNEHVAEFCLGRHRLVPFANVNPYLVTRPEEELRYCLDALGMKGVKLYPSYQHFYPNDRRLYRFYQLAEERGILVMSHTGSSIFPGARMRFSDPIYWDDVAVDFPELKIALVHSGRGFWYEKASFLAQLHTNVYLEIAGLPPKNLLQYIPRLEDLSSKVLFGSDWPGSPTPKRNIQAIRELPINEQSKSDILGGNASRLLHLG